MKNFLFGVMATVLCVSLLGAKFQDAAPKKYEVRTVYKESDAGKLSNDGWRLVGFGSGNLGRPGLAETYVFEREKR